MILKKNSEKNKYLEGSMTNNIYFKITQKKKN